MNRPSDIPPDLWDDAIKITSAMPFALRGRKVTEALARYALTVRQNEREACALAAERRSPDDDSLDYQVRKQVAAAIRNRGEPNP